MSVAKHTAFNLLGATLPMVLAMVTLPFYIRIIGLDRYGVISIAWLVVGYFGLFDFGLGRAVAQRLAMLDVAPASSRNDVFWVAAMLSAFLATSAAFLSYFGASFALDWVGIARMEVRLEAHQSIPMLMGMVGIGVGNSLLNGALEGRRDFRAANLISLVGACGATVVPLAFASVFGPSLVNLIGAALMMQVIAFAMFCITVRRTLPLSRPKRFPRDEIQRILSFGGWTSVSNLISPVLAFSDRLIVGRVLGAAAVGIYSIPMNLVQNLAILPSAISRTLFPQFAAVEISESKKLRDEALHLTLFLLTPIAVGFALVLGPFLKIWIGEDIAGKAFPIGIVLVVGAWMSGHARIPQSHLSARQKPKSVAIIHSLELVPYLTLLWFLLQKFGVLGAAAAWTTRTSVDALLLHYKDATGYRSMARIMSHAIFLTIVLVIIASFPPVNLVGLLAALVISTATFLLCVFDLPLVVRTMVLPFLQYFRLGKNM